MKSTEDLPPDIGVLALRRLLEESSDLHRAITSDEVDGFVVGRDDASRRVVLLANAYQRYRQLVEHMEQGAVTVSAQGNVLYANQTFANMLEMSLALVYTSPLETYTVVGDRARLASFLMLSAQESSVEVTLRRQDNALLPVRLSLVNTSEGYSTLMVTDLRPMQWRTLAIESLASIERSVEQLCSAGPDAPGSDPLNRLLAQVRELTRMLEQAPQIRAPESNVA